MLPSWPEPLSFVLKYLADSWTKRYWCILTHCTVILILRLSSLWPILRLPSFWPMEWTLGGFWDPGLTFHLLNEIWNQPFLQGLIFLWEKIVSLWITKWALRNLFKRQLHVNRSNDFHNLSKLLWDFWWYHQRPKSSSLLETCASF